MTFKYRYRKQIIIISIIVILIGSITGLLVWKYLIKDKTESIKENKEIVKTNKKSLEKKVVDNIEKYKVDIKGEINNPGIYSLEKDKRVIDVIVLAGGLTENADTSVLNLSKKITDEMVIIIYSKDQVNDFKKTKEVEKQVEEKCIKADENSLNNDACITSNSPNKVTVNGKVNLNTASLEELMTLQGIGESKAKDIISYRETNNGFKSIDELTNIPGIGESTLAQIKENITV